MMARGMHTELRDFMEWLEAYDNDRARKRLFDEIECLIIDAEAGDIEAQPDAEEIAQLAAGPMLRHVEAYYTEDVLKAEFAEAQAAGWQRARKSPVGMLPLMYRKPSWWHRVRGLAPGIKQAKDEADRFARDSLFLEECIVIIVKDLEFSLFGDAKLEELSGRLCAALGRPQVRASSVAGDIRLELNKGIRQAIRDPFMARKRRAKADREIGSKAA